MCFSPEADFTAAAVVGVVGVATLRLVREPRDLLIAALPLLFALHQFVEGFVWLRGSRGTCRAGCGDGARERRRDRGPPGAAVPAPAHP